MSDKALPEGVTEGKTCKPRTSPEGVQEQRPRGHSKAAALLLGLRSQGQERHGECPGPKDKAGCRKKAQELHSLLAWKS